MGSLPLYGGGCFVRSYSVSAIHDPRCTIRNEESAQRVSFGAGCPADIRTDIPADVRGQKLPPGPRNPGKISISVRTSMTRRRGRPRPQGDSKKLRSEKLRAEFQRMPWGGGKRRGVENLTNDTPPKRGFGTPPPTVRFPPLSGVSALFFLYKNPRQSRQQKLFWRGPKIFGRARSLVRFPPPPYVLQPPPHITAQLLRAMGFLASQHGQLGAIPPPPFLSVSPLCSVFPVQKSRLTKPARGPKIFGRARSLVRFAPPIRFAPPHITAQEFSLVDVSDIFYFSPRGRGRGVRGAWRGGGGVGFPLKIPGEGSPVGFGGGGVARGCEAVCVLGGGLNFLFWAEMPTKFRSSVH